MVDVSPVQSRSRANLSLPKPLQLSAHELPDLEEWSEDNTSARGGTPAVEVKTALVHRSSAEISPLMSQKAIQMDTLTAKRKISVVSPVANLNMHLPLNVPGTSVSSENFIHLLDENKEGVSCDDVKNWWTFGEDDDVF
uniref:Uncharacterized protein n=1 Tax=Acrobeloides nanus TaxID=290746 RepID=A0A914D6K0_9BILA